MRHECFHVRVAKNVNLRHPASNVDVLRWKNDSSLGSNWMFSIKSHAKKIPVAVTVSFSHFQRNTICGKSLKASTISCFLLNDIPCEFIIDPQETYTTPSLALSSNSLRRKCSYLLMYLLSKHTYPSDHTAGAFVIARCEFHQFQPHWVQEGVGRLWMILMSNNFSFALNPSNLQNEKCWFTKILQQKIFVLYLLHFFLITMLTALCFPLNQKALGCYFQAFSVIILCRLFDSVWNKMNLQDKSDD